MTGISMETMANIFTSIEFSSAVMGALVGALAGGFFSWFAAFYTMRKQRKLDEEQRRIEAMPLLRMDLEEMLPGDNDFSVFGIENGELLTSANPDPEAVYTFLCISPDVGAVFNFKVSEVYAEPLGIMKQSSAFAPLPVQLLCREKEKVLFLYLDKLERNINVAVRFRYEDVFGNGYVQDAFFMYLETEYGGRKRKILTKREVFQPQWEKEGNGKKRKIKSLEEVVDMLAFNG